MGKVRLKTSLQKLVAQDKNAYVSRMVTFSRIPTDEVIQHASRASGIPEPIMGAAFTAIAIQVEELVLNGHSVSLGNLGTLRMGVSCKSSETAEDVTSNNVRVRRILLTPSMGLKAKLKQVNIVTENPYLEDEKEEEEEGNVAD
jgi:predicted histone-like DNA-binding protein